MTNLEIEVIEHAYFEPEEEATRRAFRSAQRDTWPAGLNELREDKMSMKSTGIVWGDEE